MLDRIIEACEPLGNKIIEILIKYGWKILLGVLIMIVIIGVALK